MLMSVNILSRTLRNLAAFAAGAAALCGCVAGGAMAQESAPRVTPAASVESASAASPSYADLVDLALAAQSVVVVLVSEQITVPPERAPGVPPGKARLYVEALTQNLLAAQAPMGESVVFLVDVEVDSRGRPITVEEQPFIVFGDRVPDQPGALQLLSSAAMMPATAELEARVREVLGQLAAADALSAITNVRDVISVPGNLAGESETQLFVETASGEPVSLSVIRRPGMEPVWGVSLGEIVDQSARPAQPGTIAWYRFACELPPALPDSAFLQSDRDARERARADYAFIREQLGPCERRVG